MREFWRTVAADGESLSEFALVLTLFLPPKGALAARTSVYSHRLGESSCYDVNSDAWFAHKGNHFTPLLFQTRVPLFAMLQGFVERRIQNRNLQMRMRFGIFSHLFVSARPWAHRRVPF